MKKTEFSSELLRERYTLMEHESGLSVYVFPKKLTSTYALFATKYGSIDNAFIENGTKITVPDGIEILYGDKCLAVGENRFQIAL